MTREEINRRRLNLSMSQKTPTLMKPKLRKGHQGTKKNTTNKSPKSTGEDANTEEGKILKEEKDDEP